MKPSPRPRSKCRGCLPGRGGLHAETAEVIFFMSWIRSLGYPNPLFAFQVTFPLFILRQMRIVRWIWQRLKSENLWSGIFPTLILTLFALIALRQTTEQIKILREEIRYQREPVLIVYSYPSKQPPFPIKESGLYLANIGNDTAKNVNLRLGLFLINEKTIYSYGQFQNPSRWIIDSTRGPRGLLMSRLQLKPDTAVDLMPRIEMLLFQPFLDVHEKDDPLEELFAIQNLFKGEYVLFAEYSFKRSSDFAQKVDTSYFRFSYHQGPHSNLKEEVGGLKVIERLRKYMENGPQLSINIFRDRYEVYKHTFGAFPPTVLRLPRKIAK